MKLNSALAHPLEDATFAAFFCNKESYSPSEHFICLTLMSV